MVERFTQSRKSLNLSLHALARISEEDAYQVFCQVRWLETDGVPYCPRCGTLKAYVYTDRSIFKCRGCGHQFSVTSGTIFARRKMPFGKLLYLVAQFATTAKGRNSIELAKHVGCRPMSAFINAHKMREAMETETASAILREKVEVDGCYFGKYRKKANFKENRVDLRKQKNPKQKVMVVARERGGRAIVTTVPRETASLPWIIDRVDHEATVYADEARGWDPLDETFHTKRIDHSECYALGDICTNQAESFFSRARRMEAGIYHHIAADYFDLYAAETAWRENNRRVSDMERYQKVLRLTLRHPPSRRLAGYWQRKPTDKGRR